MKVCVDVDYRTDGAVAACVGFRAWSQDTPSLELRQVSSSPPAEYESGQFYRRELPYLMQLLGALAEPPELVIVDGFVWLDGGRPGLGAHLHAALGGGCPVIGVAKRAFHGAAQVVEILRGDSQVPLYVSSVGQPLEAAAEQVRNMHGAYRLPTLLKRADSLARS